MSRSAADVYMTEVCGTPEYLAPEVILKKPYTESVDLWALGLISFIMLSGSYPFILNQDRLAMFKAIVKADFSLNDQVIF